MSSLVVPQCPPLKAATSPKIGAPGTKMRTGLLTSYSGAKTGALISETGSSLISKTGGTWNTLHRLPKKKPMKVSSALNGDQLLAMMDTFTGAALSSDLNTPEIKFEDFQFTGKTVNSYNDSNMEVESSLDAFEHAINGDCSIVEDSLSTDTYTLFDMSSPISRDVLQADQHEQRVNIQEFTNGVSGDVATNTRCIPSMAIPELNFVLPQPQTTSDVLGTSGLGAFALGQPQVMEPTAPCYSPPQLSISNDDCNFTIPPEVLEQMNSIFPEEMLEQIDSILPEEPILSSNPTANEVCSTELDIHLGAHTIHGDLLSGALQDSGLLTHDLDALNFEENDIELSTIDMKPILLPNNNPWQESTTIVQPDNPLPVSSPCLITNPLAFINDSNYHSEMITPTASSSSSSTTCPKIPSKKRPGKCDITPTGSIKRVRRTSRKPLRFREEDAFGDSILTESGDDEINFVKVTKSVADMRGVQPLPKVKEELELSNIPTAGRKDVRQLTEEQKYHRIRELNNEASKRCRQKRKMTVKEMEVEMKSLEERNKILKKKHEDLAQLRERFQTFVNDFFRKRLASSNN